MTTRVCVISFKECWPDSDGTWYSNGGFPLQMTAIASLFDAMTLLITRRERPGEGGLPLPAGADVVVLRQPAGSDLRRKLSVAASLIYYLRTIARHVRQADVVHVPLPGDIPFLGMLVALALRKRLIARYGGSWVANRQTTLMNRVTRMLMRRFAGGRNVMLATGEGETPPAPGMRWIFATALSAEELRAIRPIPDRGLSDPPRIVYIGRLSPEKGVAHLIEAVALLDREGFRPLPEVVLIGSGPERASLEAQVEESGYLRRVRFAGQLDRAGLSAELQRADLCVQPSLTEGFSKAWLDAFAHGLPVLASEVGAARSVIGTNGERGWLAPPGDVRVLARQIRCILTEATDWPALRRRCIAFAQERTLDAWAREIGQVCAKQWNMALVEGRIRSARVMG